MLEYLYKDVSRKKMLLYTFIFIGFMVVVLPVVSYLSSQWIGVSDSPDIMIDGTIDSYVNLRESYGETGRRVYIILRYTFDLVWPFVYTMFFISVISYLDYNRVKKYGKYILLIPLIGVAFDLLENVLATIFMSTHPTINELLIHSLYYASLIKWIMMVLALFVTIQMSIQYVFFKERFYVTE